MRRHFKICPRIHIQHCLLVGRGLLLYSHTGQGWWGHHHLDDALPETCAFFSFHCSACIFFWDNVCTSMRVSEKSMNKVYRDMTSCFAHPHPIVRSRSRSKESWAPYSASEYSFPPIPMLGFYRLPPLPFRVTPFPIQYTGRGLESHPHFPKDSFWGWPSVSMYPASLSFLQDLSLSCT